MSLYQSMHDMFPGKNFFSKPEDFWGISLKKKFNKRKCKIKKKKFLTKCTKCGNKQLVTYNERTECIKCHTKIASREGGKKRCLNCGNYDFNRRNTCSECTHRYPCLDNVRKKLKIN